MSNRVRVAILGAASFAEVGHIPGLRAHPQAEAVAIYSRDRARAQSMAERNGVPQASDDLDALLARDDIDAVTIVSSNEQHHPYAMAALVRGKHVFCEKPMALDASQAAEMTREAGRRGLVNQIAFTFRHTYCLEEMRRRVTAGDIGPPYFIEVHGEWYSRLFGAASKPTWRDEPERYGPGHLGEMGSHFIDTVNYVCGPACGFISDVAAMTESLPRRVEDAEGEREVRTVDLAAFLVRTERGLQGQVLASRATPPPVSYGLVHGREDQRGHMGYVIVTGERGALMATFTRGDVEALHEAIPGKAWRPVELPAEASDGQPHGVTRMMRSFVDAVLRGASDGERDATFEDGYRAQAAMAAIVKASDSRRWEPVPTRLE